jgi:hypothetical protein
VATVDLMIGDTLDDLWHIDWWQELMSSGRVDDYKTELMVRGRVDS